MNKWPKLRNGQRTINDRLLAKADVTKDRALSTSPTSEPRRASRSRSEPLSHLTTLASTSSPPESPRHSTAPERLASSSLVAGGAFSRIAAGLAHGRPGLQSTPSKAVSSGRQGHSGSDWTRERRSEAVDFYQLDHEPGGLPPRGGARDP